MTWQIPWVISGVDEIGIAMGRVLAYVASSGAEGVVGPNDLKVTQTSTASGNVQIGTGAFICISEFSNAAYESYIGSNTGSAESVAVPDTSTGERYDLVYAYVTDPGAAGQGTTPYPVRTAVATGVASTTTRINQVAGLSNVTGLALARIKRAGGRGTVVTSEITDLRNIANPRSITLNRFSNITAAQPVLGSNAQTYPSDASWQVAIPFWATHAQIIMNGSGFVLRGEKAEPIVGTSQVNLGSISTIKSKFDTSLGSAPPERLSIALAAENPIPANLRGTDQTLSLNMVKTSGAAELLATSGTNIVVSLTFVEKVGT